MTIRVTVQNDEPAGSNRPAIGLTIVDASDASRVVQPEVLVSPGSAITFFLWHTVNFVAREVEAAAPPQPVPLEDAFYPVNPVIVVPGKPAGWGAPGPVTDGG